MTILNQTVLIDELLSFTKYSSWADLQKTTFQEEVNRIVADDSEAAREHERRWFGFLSYWYASLYVVIEAWDELKFSDPVVDQLLAVPNMRQFLRRYRNAVFHFQGCMTTPKLLDFLSEGEKSVYWAITVHNEFLRFLADHLSGLVITDEQRSELREDIEACVHWYPHRSHKSFDRFERTLAWGRTLLAQYPGGDPETRREIEQLLECNPLPDSLRGWETSRAELLRKAGLT